MKKTKRILALVLCLAMILPMTPAFEAAGAEQGVIPDEDFENITIDDIKAPDYYTNRQSTSDLGISLETFPPTVVMPTAVTNKVLSTASTYYMDSGTFDITGVPSSTGEISFDIRIDNAQERGAQISFVNYNGTDEKVAATFMFHRKSASTAYTDDELVVAYSAESGGGTFPSFHPKFPVIYRSDGNPLYINKATWYNITLKESGSNFAFYLNGEHIADIPKRNSSFGSVNRITLVKSQDKDATANDIAVDNIILKQYSYSTPYYFEDFEGDEYVVGQDAPSTWSNVYYGSKKLSLKIKSASPTPTNSKNDLVAANKAIEVGYAGAASGTHTVPGNIPSFTGEVEFDVFSEYAGRKGIYIDLMDDSGKYNTRIIFFNIGYEHSATLGENTIGVAYEGTGGITHSFHTSYPCVYNDPGTNTDPVLLKLRQWYNVKLKYTENSTTVALYIDDEKIGDIPIFNTSVKAISKISIGRFSSYDASMNNYLVDNISLKATSDSVPYYFEDFEGDEYVAGQNAPTDLWGNYETKLGVRDEYSPRLNSSRNTAIVFKGSDSNLSILEKAVDMTGSQKITEFSFDFNASYVAASRGVAVRLLSGTTQKTSIAMFSPKGSNTEFDGKILFWYWDNKNLETPPSYSSHPQHSQVHVMNNSIVTPDEWHNVTIKYSEDASTAAFYIDGVLIKENVNNMDATSLKTITKIEIVSMGNYQSDLVLFDNIKIKGDGGVCLNETFENTPTGSVPNGWNWSGSDSYKILARKTVNNPNTNDQIEYLPENTALRFRKNGPEIFQLHRVFNPTSTMSISFDFMASLLAGQNKCGAYISPCASADNTYKYPIRIFQQGTDSNVAALYLPSNGKTVANLNVGKWYNIKIEMANGTAKLYLDGEYLSDMPDGYPSSATVDRVIFQNTSSGIFNETFYIDNLKFTGATAITVVDMLNDFKDTFATGDGDAYSYTGSGSHTVSGGKLSLTGDITVKRSLTARALAGKLGLTFNSNSPAGTIFTLTGDSKTAFGVKIGDGGELLYKRDTKWNKFTNYGTITADKDYEISFDLPSPEERNANYVNVRVDGKLVGTISYDVAFSYIDAFNVTVPTGATVTIDDVYGAESDGIIALSDKGEEKTPELYVNEIIEGAKVIYKINDSTPHTATLNYATEGAGPFQLTKTYNSIGVDLGEKQRVNAIRIIGDRLLSDRVGDRPLSTDLLRVWYSDDNANWDVVSGVTYYNYVENGVNSALVEFSDVEARYVKVNYNRNSEGTNYDGEKLYFRVADIATDVRAERRITRQWGLAATAFYAENDTYPTGTPMISQLDDSAFTFDEGDSIGLNFGMHSNVEAIEITAAGVSTLGLDAFELYGSLNNMDYVLIEDIVVSRDVRDDKEYYRLTFDNVKCGYLKLHNVNGGTISLNCLGDAIDAYSSINADRIHQPVSPATSAGCNSDGGFYIRPDGALVATFTGFKPGTSATDWSEYSILATQTTDGGHTWTKSWIDLNRRQDTDSIMTVSYIPLSNGGIGAIYLEKFSMDVAQIYFRPSYDGGRTWESAVLVSEGLEAYTIMASGMRGCRLSTGRILIPVNYNPYTNDTSGTERSIAMIFYSDDEGRTWKMANNALTVPTAALEPVCAETADGKVLMTIRTRVQGKIYQALSADGGLTWEQPHALDLQAVDSTNIVVKIPQTEDVLLLWNNYYPDPAIENSNYKRDPLTMAITSDNGQTYHNVKNILENKGTYSGIIFSGRAIALQNEKRLDFYDISELYHTVYGNVTVADLTPAETPTGTNYANGWLTGVSNTMCYSTDGGATWKFCGGKEVHIGDGFTNVLVQDIGTATTAPSEIHEIVKN